MDDRHRVVDASYNAKCVAKHRVGVKTALDAIRERLDQLHDDVRKAIAARAESTAEQQRSEQRMVSHD
jgi:hypothetical protein